ncbi:MAG TPA: quinone oxidoreductase [Paenibacillaceae bacterium]
MKAIRVHEYGGPEVLVYEEVPDPVPGPGELLVEVRAAGVNFADIVSRIGRYRPALPWIPGNEAAGVVIGLGEGAEGFKIGDRVAWATAPAGLQIRYTYPDKGGKVRDTVARTYAERAVVPADRAVKIPDGLGFEEAAAVILQGITAHYLAFAAYPIKPGDRVLIHAGAGGVGLLLTQLAKECGATVYTTVSSEEKAAMSREAGADHVILYTKENFAEVVDRLTDGAGVEAVYDSVGAATFEGSLQSLRPRGYLIYYGMSSGPVPPFDLSRLNTGSYYVTRPSFAHYTETREELVMRAESVFHRVAEGKLKVRIHGVYPLKEAAEAHRAIEERRVSGKVVLVP